MTPCPACPCRERPIGGPGILDEFTIAVPIQCGAPGYNRIAKKTEADEECTKICGYTAFLCVKRGDEGHMYLVQPKGQHIHRAHPLCRLHSTRGCTECGDSPRPPGVFQEATMGSTLSGLIAMGAALEEASSTLSNCASPTALLPFVNTPGNVEYTICKVCGNMEHLANGEQVRMRLSKLPALRGWAALQLGCAPGGTLPFRCAHANLMQQVRKLMGLVRKMRRLSGSGDRDFVVAKKVMGDIDTSGMPADFISVLKSKVELLAACDDIKGMYPGKVDTPHMQDLGGPVVLCILSPYILVVIQCWECVDFACHLAMVDRLLDCGLSFDGTMMVTFLRGQPSQRKVCSWLNICFCSPFM